MLPETRLPNGRGSCDVMSVIYAMSHSSFCIRVCDAKSHALGVCHTHLAYTSSSHAYLLNPPAFLQSPATSRCILLCIRVFQLIDVRVHRGWG